jgi:phage-related protein
MEMTALSRIKPVVWIGTTKPDLTSFPEDVKDAIGYALYIAQGGRKHADAKPLRGFSGAGILDADSGEVDQGSGVKAISIPAIPIR